MAIVDYSPVTGIKATSSTSCLVGRIMTAGYVFCISFQRRTRSRSERFHHGNQRARATNISSIVFHCQVTVSTLYMSTNCPTIINLHLICLIKAILHLHLICLSQQKAYQSAEIFSKIGVINCAYNFFLTATIHKKKT